MPAPTAAWLTIGQVAKSAGVNTETIRYYERLGLLHQPAKPAYSIRRYPPDTVQHVQFIKHAQGLGFTLAEIQELLTLRRREHAPCAEVKRRAEQKLRDLGQKIQALSVLQQDLEKLVQACDAEKAKNDDCPLLNALDTPGPP